MVEASAELEPQAKQQLLRRVDESIHETQQYHSRESGPNRDR